MIDRFVPVDIDREFSKHFGKMNLCGFEVRASAVLHSYDEDMYNNAVNSFAESKGYVKFGDIWHRDTEPLDFSGVGGADDR